MIQDIEPHEYRNEYKKEPPGKESIYLAYEDGCTLTGRNESGIFFPSFQDVEKVCAEKELYEEYTYLFSIDGVGYYLGDIRKAKGLCAEPYAYQMEPVRIFRTAVPKYLSFAGITGWQLHNWYDSRRFCGHCGAPMVQDEKERMMRCPSCKRMEFPKICPAVIIGVINKDKILMSKYAGREYKNYALLAGFNEIGETIEETVRREVLEEVGLKVKNIRYYKSQPWSFSDTLLMGFFCELDGEDQIKLDEDELAMADWFERDQMPVKAEDLSLTNEMMMAFKENRI